jgi:outer membrane protein OmpA-like peptidoglycan-associated protein
MKNIFLLSLIMIFCNLSISQNVRWSYKVEGSIWGAGKPLVSTYRFWKYCGAVEVEDAVGEGLKKSEKSPAELHYQFIPLKTQQLIIIENYNPGAITKVEIGTSGKKGIRQEIYSGKAKAEEKKYRILNLFCPLTDYEVTDVWISVDYKAVEGVNQIAAVAISSLKEAYTPKINLTADLPFEGEPLNINEDITGEKGPSALRVSADGKYIFFDHNNGYEAIYFSMLGADGKCKDVKYSSFNIPVETSTATGLVAIMPDLNSAIVSNMNKKPYYYEVYFDKKSRLKKRQITVKGYLNNENANQNEIMSADGNTFIITQWRPGDLDAFHEDLYFAHRLPNGDFSELTNMGTVINTDGDEIPCFLSPDNTTLYFSSNGHMGFGDYDIFVTRRFDDTWTKWSEPVNIGSQINTDEKERYFTITASGEYAYFTKGKTIAEKDLYRIKLAKPKAETPIIETVRPNPVVLISGRVLDKKTNLPLESEITFELLSQNKTVGYARSNSITGEYTITLPAGENYSFRAVADNYITISENMDATQITEYIEIKRDLYLAPIEVGQIIRLNNIFFETGKADLKPESNFELEKLTAFLLDNLKVNIEISGHTDNVGGEQSNMKLSEDRAKAVVTYLLSKSIPENRIIAKGYGETKFIATNDTEEGKQLNRRVEFIILTK